MLQLLQEESHVVDQQIYFKRTQIQTQDVPE